jgi:hypothetical protein
MWRECVARLLVLPLFWGGQRAWSRNEQRSIRIREIDTVARAQTMARTFEDALGYSWRIIQYLARVVVAATGGERGGGAERSSVDPPRRLTYRPFPAVWIAPFFLDIL